MVVGLGLHLSMQFIAESEVGFWILAFNNWNDAGLWVDSASWND